ncbi:MAG TPA: hypothetical protein VGL34_03425 [Steroidobacteraceae bacterium]|jgi:hypothetical protein
MLKEKFAQRFVDLHKDAQMLTLHRSGTPGSQGYYKDFRGWATSAQSLIRAVFTETSPHYTGYVEALRLCTNGLKSNVDNLKDIFGSAKDAFENGYVFDVEAQVSGELFGDFVTMAKRSLDEGHKDVAAVLACAALEDALKRYALANSLTVDGKTMQDIVGGLKAKGLVTGAQKGLLEAMPKIRDYAMHARWDKITAPDVSSVIGYVEQFLLTHFS